ncbi:reverse transcriptase domain-containing protein [Tanacetum coccineum]
MDDEPMWAVDRVVASTPGSAITIPETANEFSIKVNHLILVKGNQFDGNIIKIFYHGLNEITQEVLNAATGGIFLYKTLNQAYQLLKDKVILKLDWAKNQKTKSSLKKTIAFAAEGRSNSDTDKIMARMDAMTIKMDAQYKELQSRAKQPTPNLDEDDMPINTQPNPRGNNSKAYQPPQSRNEHVNVVFTRSGKSYDPPVNPNDQQNESAINFDSDDEEEEPAPQPKTKTPKPIKETPIPKPYKPKMLYLQRLRKEKMKAQYGKFLDMIRAVRINVPLVDVLAGMPNYGKFLKELIRNKHKIEQISSAFLSDESSAIIQNKVPPKLGDPGNENMLVEVHKFIFPVDFVILKMEEDSKVPLILGRPFLHIADAVIRVKQKQLNLGFGTLFYSCDHIIQLSAQNKSKLVSILKKHKEAFAWKTTDSPGISPSFCKHKIQLLDDKKPIVQKQRRLNPNMQEVVKKEIVKLLDTGIIYPIADSPWVSPIHCVPKKGGITIVTNENDELVPTRTVTGWRVCIDYRKLNEATVKDHFPLLFMDQMLERLTGYKYSFFPDGFSGYFQIPIDPINQEKTAFTCPFGTYAYRRMPFGLCNAPATFQRCMLAIFHDMTEESVEVFMDDFSIFRNSFDKCLNNLDKILLSCIDAHLVLNWENVTSWSKKELCLDTSPNWNLPFELMCDASDFAVGVVLEFDIEIKDNKGIENVAADHLSWIDNNETSDDSEVDGNFLRETLMEINTRDEPWSADLANYLVGDIIPKGMTYQQKNKFFSDLKHYFWKEPYLFKVCSDGMIRRCVYGPETCTILNQCHDGPTGGHYGPNVTTKKVLDSGFYWPNIIKEAHTLILLCEECQKTGNISKRDEMPLTNIQVCEIFDVRGIDFMRPFSKSYKFEYILIAIDYIFKWAEAQALPTNDARVVNTFLKKLFCRFGMPKALISD